MKNPFHFIQSCAKAVLDIIALNPERTLSSGHVAGTVVFTTGNLVKLPNITFTKVDT